jgi:hypothetical protein
MQYEVAVYKGQVYRNEGRWVRENDEESTIQPCGSMIKYD